MYHKYDSQKFLKLLLHCISVLTGEKLNDIFSLQISFCGQNNTVSRAKARGLRVERASARWWDAAGNYVQQSVETPSLEVGTWRGKAISFRWFSWSMIQRRRQREGHLGQKLRSICHVRFAYILLRVVGETMAQGTILCSTKHWIINATVLLFGEYRSRKVKVTLQQAMKAHRGSRGIAILFL